MELDKLATMMAMQDTLDERIKQERNIEMSKSDWVTKLTIAMESEIDEIRREVNWKWWKDEKEIDSDALKDEVIDLWHFLMSLSREVGMDSEEVFRRYTEKNAENHARQDGTSERSDEGYTANVENGDGDER